MYLYLLVYVCIYLWLLYYFVIVGLIQIKSVPIADYNFNLYAPDLYSP